MSTVTSDEDLARKSRIGTLLERVAKQIYDSWKDQFGWVPWQDGGNSDKQNEARQIASRVFELALASKLGGEL